MKDLFAHRQSNAVANRNIVLNFWKNFDINDQDICLTFICNCFENYAQYINAKMICNWFFNTSQQIYNWTPKVFNETNEDQITDPESKAIYKKMPSFLKKAIAEVPSSADVSLLYYTLKFSNNSLFQM